MLEKLKSLLADDALYFALLLVLVGVVSFGLGQRSVAGQSGGGPAASLPAGVTFSQAPTTTAVQPAPTPTPADQVVASRSGTKYHRLDCPGAAQIKDTNKVYFDSPALAQAAGYTPAANCPGL